MLAAVEEIDSSPLTPLRTTTMEQYYDQDQNLDQDHASEVGYVMAHVCSLVGTTGTCTLRADVL